MISLRKFIKSVRYAIKGIVHVLQHEQNFRMQAAITIIVIILIFWLKPTSIEVMILILTVMIIIAVEFTNTVFERVTDVLKPRLHPYAKVIKDVMAGSVLVSVVGAIAIGIIVFLPKLIDQLN